MNITRTMIEVALPIILLTIGLLEILLIPFLGERQKKRRFRRVTVRIVILLTTLIMIVIYPEVLNQPMEWHIANIFGNGIIFRIDLLSLLFMIFAGFIFFVVSLHTAVDIKGCGRERSFYLFFMLTYISTIGTLMAGDLLSFFMFFEIMTFSSFVLMVHQRGQKVIEAGATYIYFGILGGLSILAGILVLSAFTQNYEWVTLGEKFGELGNIKYVSAALFIIGFGIKAGMAPLHHWVPVIYPKAHLSVNALSSGILMKVGGYGILRLIVSVLASTEGQNDVVVNAITVSLEDIGAIVIWLGIITMVVGVISALEQEKMVRMLAYHSVSQMGYVIMGIGVAAYLGFDGAMGFAGAFYHMINHGIFKGLLFLMAGAVFFKTKEKNMYKLGGLYKQMPYVATVGLIASLAITGMPLFNGYASKTILHHAIEEAHIYGHPGLVWAEYIFTFVSACTAASFIKLYSRVFLGSTPKKYQHLKEEYNLGTIAMGIMATVILIIGLFPNALLNHFIIPAARTLHFDEYFIDNYLVGMELFNSYDLTNMIIVYALGMLIYTVGMKFNLFHIHLPKQLDLESDYYTPIYQKTGRSFNRYVHAIENFISKSDVFIYGSMLLVLILMLLNFL
ncbi:Formate hydrogenlyase subunit 3/Multisubunit Na+/H+ antiporter, MnhD subunit [Pelagirhabdus alkalitolerans]|uniref:Formate hydrogenlyase subunit 3/Multisubunit Na+/H+ antiporter, MnhD subunit n=1 Tax=Pelagirhabdus alkalitolerans TaxID=1612202 RepID=A0A1G6H944_9BACI|nr:complex I subunit 5 family protein [Pelagirhabdus alkalitolerans]SDB90475.1 Formate hydrogenlyase subunit 3/Multisubunit Na+/H+ antiporter, MnhD subunit [Pelagirhabdus alkalitolerans]